MKCPSCGAEYPDGFRVCKKCGAFVSSIYQEQTDKAMPEPVPRAKRNEERFDPQRIVSSLKTSEPIIGGSALIVMSIIALAISLIGVSDLESIDSLGIDEDDRMTNLVRTIFMACAVLSVIGVIGGLAAVNRRYFAVATAGCISAVLFGFVVLYGWGILAALLVWALIATSQGEFKPTFPERRVPLPDD